MATKSLVATFLLPDPHTHANIIFGSCHYLYRMHIGDSRSMTVVAENGIYDSLCGRDTEIVKISGSESTWLDDELKFYCERVIQWQMEDLNTPL